MIDKVKDAGWNIRIPDNRQGFSSKFIEHLFYVYAFDTHLTDTPILRDIINVINSKNILFCNSNQIISWYFANRESMTWDSYDASHAQIHSKITQFVDSRFDRDQPFSSYTLVDKFYDAFIANNYETIKSTYNRYTEDPKNINHVMYISLVSYAVESTHYFYILQFDKFYGEIIPKNEEAFGCITRYAASLRLTSDSGYKKKVEDDRWVTFIDFKRNDMLYKLKPLGDDKLKDVINALMAIMIEKRERGEEEKRIAFNTIILSKGLLNKWRMNIPKTVLDHVETIVMSKK